MLELQDAAQGPVTRRQASRKPQSIPPHQLKQHHLAVGIDEWYSVCLGTKGPETKPHEW